MNRLFLVATTGLALLAAPAASFAAAADCPNGGTVRFGVEPYESSEKLLPIFNQVAEILGKKIDCKVQMFIATSYNAEIEAMRSDKLEIGEFGPLGYVLAHEVAKAEAVSAYSDGHGKPSSYTAGIVTWPGSGITSIKDVAGKSFGYSDPASTSGHLFPAYWLSKNGIDPDKGVRAQYAGSHTASYEALRNHKVQAGELNSDQIGSATRSGGYKASDFVELWRSDSIPNDPIAVRGDLPAGFKARLTTALKTLDLSALSVNDRKELNLDGISMVPQSDSAFDSIRDLVKVLHIDLKKLNS